MIRAAFLLLAAAGCASTPMPVPAAEVEALERELHAANPPLEGFRARGTVVVKADFFLPLTRERTLDFHAAAAPGRAFVLLRHPFGTVVKAGLADGEMWAVAMPPFAAEWRGPIGEADGPAPVMLARDLLVAFDLARPVPIEIALGRLDGEVVGESADGTRVFAADGLRLRRRDLAGVRIEHEGGGRLPESMVVRGRRLKERMTVKVEWFEIGPVPAAAFRSDSTDRVGGGSDA